MWLENLPALQTRRLQRICRQVIRNSRRELGRSIPLLKGRPEGRRRILKGSILISGFPLLKRSSQGRRPGASHCCAPLVPGFPLFRSPFVTDLIHNASDDQIALTVCFAAVAISGLVMYFSYHVGVFARNIRSGTIPLPVSHRNGSTEIPATQAIRDKAA